MDRPLMATLFVFFMSFSVMRSNALQVQAPQHIWSSERRAICDSFVDVVSDKVSGIQFDSCDIKIVIKVTTTVIIIMIIIIILIIVTVSKSQTNHTFQKENVWTGRLVKNKSKPNTSGRKTATLKQKTHHAWCWWNQTNNLAQNNKQKAG